eukprot:jgi/Bigna1/47624/estExt_Genewise1.C_160089
MISRLLHALIFTAVAADYAFVQIEKPSSAANQFVGLFGSFGKKNSTLAGRRFALAKPYLACKPISGVKGAIVVMGRGECAFSTKCAFAERAGAAGCVVVNNATEIYEMGASPGSKRLPIPAVMIDSVSGASLVQALKKHTVYGKLVRFERPLFDASIAVLVLMAVGTVAGGAYWSAARERDGSARYARIDAENGEEEEEEPAVLNEYFAWGFIVVASLGLVILFYFIDYLIYVLVFIFCLAGAQGLFLSLTSFAKTVLPPAFTTASYQLPQLGKITWVNTAVTVISVGLAVLWGVYRKASFAWILQDILGIAFLLTLQRTVQLPNVKVAGILLVLAFLYDIFWVFLSPFFFQQSVMVKVATGGSSGEAMPMLLKMPRLTDPTPGDSLLGLGDIAIPGLYISHLLRFDYETDHHWVFGDSCSTDRSRRTNTVIGFFSVAMIGYVAGLILCDIVLIATKMGQPALLYIVPCVLLPVLMLAKSRGSLKALWGGKGMNEPPVPIDGSGYSMNHMNGNSEPYKNN